MGEVAAATSPTQTAYNFFTWYKKHQEEISSNSLLDNADGQDSTKFYAVNFASTEDFLDEISKSGFVSKAYLTKWRKYFRRQADYLRLHPQNDGPPAGFEFDLITNSQEPEILAVVY